MPVAVLVREQASRLLLSGASSPAIGLHNDIDFTYSKMCAREGATRGRPRIDALHVPQARHERADALKCVQGL